jgi:cytochrome c553
MTPPPPVMSKSVVTMKPEALFYVVKHGIKFTGMPAWPAQQRDDEVWAVVAFLQKYPGMNAAEYASYVYGESPPFDSLSTVNEPLALATQMCARCHGPHGHGRGSGAFPRLAGQSEDYLVAALDAYASGARYSGIMEPIAAELSAEDRSTLAAYFEQQPAAESADDLAVGKRDDADRQAAIARGKDTAEVGIANQNVPACVDCHGPAETPRNSLYPSLAGQDATYLLQQLELFRRRQRGGSPQFHLMHAVADGLTPPQMEDVARYFESLRIESEPASHDE